tara:strand:- start:16576 stop:16857 length:282 start_codon:yes stop_codon:yes gene_type:complete
MDIILGIINALLQTNDPLMSAIHMLLLAIIFGTLLILSWISKDRKRILTAMKEKDKVILDIIDQYYESQNTTTEAMHSIKEVLIELKTIMDLK